MGDRDSFSRDRSRSRDRDDSDNRRDRSDYDRDADNNNGTTTTQQEVFNLYITNLSFQTTDETLRAAFAHTGEITGAQVIKEPVTNASRGFAFVTYANYEESQRALEEMNGAELDGRSIRVERARRNGGYNKTPGRYLGPPQLSSKFGKKDRGRGPDVRPRYDDRYDRFDPRDAGYRDYPRDDRYRAPPAYDRLPYPDRGLPPYRDDRRDPRYDSRRAAPPLAYAEIPPIRAYSVRYDPLPNRGRSPPPRVDPYDRQRSPPPAARQRSPYGRPYPDPYYRAPPPRY